MNRDIDSEGADRARQTGGRPLGQRIILAVCERGGALPLRAAEGEPFRFAELGDVGAELLESLRPDVVLSPLVTGSFDCIDLAQILNVLAYRGAYRALSPLLPQPEMIRREIRSLCPGLDFDLIFYETA